MIILQETGAAQEVKFIARELATGACTAVFTNKVTNMSHTYSVTGQIDGFYTYFTQIMTDLKQDNTYYFVFSDMSKELFRGMVFVTNQDIDDYSINNGLYEDDSTDNTYLTA